MTSIKQSIVKFSREESGQDLIEYALIAGLLGLASVSGLNYLATFIRNGFVNIGNTLAGAV